MTTIALIESEIEQVRSLARTERLETAAVGLVFQAPGPRSKHRFVTRDFAPVPEAAYLSREPHRLTLTPRFCMELANRARALNSGVLLAHTHPNGLAEFSAIDDDGEKPLANYFERRAGGHRHFSLVAGGLGIACRELGSGKDVDVESVGAALRRYSDRGTSAPSSDSLLRFDRQLRAFGRDGQAMLSMMRVAVVGLGGTGSIVAQELAHLGVTDFILVDPDKVDHTSLNRLLGASPADVGQRKVDVAARSISRINPLATCERIARDIVDDEIAHQLIDADFVLSCTDSHASRAVLNQVAYQYLIPCIDMGVAIYVRDGAVTHVTGRVQMLAPGLPCLACAHWLDSNQIRTEMMTPQQRRQDPYFIGHSSPQPAVVSLNGTIASAAVTMFLAAVTGFPSDARMLIYDAIRGAMRPTVTAADPRCIVCSSHGALARGDTWQLPTRHESTVA